MKKTILLLIVVGLLSCHSEVKDNNSNTVNKVDTITATKESTGTTGTTNKCKIPINEINSRCFTSTVVIWVSPTERELSSLEKSMGAKNYESLEQDADEYNTNAQTFLLNLPNIDDYFISDSVNTYTFVTKTNRYVINKDKYVKEMVSPWLIILFNGRDAPFVTAPASIEEDYNNYFK